MTNGEAAAILESEAEYLYSQDEPYNRQAFKMAIEALQERKSKVGKWINEGQFAPHQGEDIFRCSLCGGHVIEYDTQVYEMNPYCKWCGAKMEANDADSNQMNDVDMYDTTCPYTNKPCIGCGSFFTECPRCAVEKVDG